MDCSERQKSAASVVAAVVNGRKQRPRQQTAFTTFSSSFKSSAIPRTFAFRTFVCTALIIGLSVLPSQRSFLRPVNAIAELEDLLLLAMMQNLAAGGGGAAGGAGGNALTGAFSGIGRGLGCNRAGIARIQHDAGPGSMPTNEVTGNGQQLHPGGAASEGGARAISVDPNPAPLIKAGEETNSISHHQRMLIASQNNNNNNGSNGETLTPFLDFEILPGFVINGSSSSSGNAGGGGASGGSGGFQRQQPMSSGQSVDPSGLSTMDGGSGATNSGAETEQIFQETTSNVSVSVSSTNDTAASDVAKTSPTRAPAGNGGSNVSIKISAKSANLRRAAPGAAANADKNKLTSMFGWDQQQQDSGTATARRRKRSIQPVYEGQAREGRRGEPSLQRGSKRHQTPGIVSNIGPSTAALKRTTGRLIESRLETLVDKISAMNAAGGNGQQINMPFNSPAGGGGGAGGGGTLGGYLHPEGFAGGIPSPQYYSPNAAAEQPSRVYAPGFARNPFDSPAANQAPWPDSQVAYVQPGQYQSGPQSAQQVLNNFLRFLPRLLEAARKK